MMLNCACVCMFMWVCDLPFFVTLFIAQQEVEITPRSISHAEWANCHTLLSRTKKARALVDCRIFALSEQTFVRIVSVLVLFMAFLKVSFAVYQEKEGGEGLSSGSTLKRMDVGNSIPARFWKTHSNELWRTEDGWRCWSVPEIPRSIRTTTTLYYYFFVKYLLRSCFLVTYNLKNYLLRYFARKEDDFG